MTRTRPEANPEAEGVSVAVQIVSRHGSQPAHTLPPAAIRHGWRATARTVLVERLGWPVEVVEHQLAHRVADMHGRAYNRTQWLPERAKMMQAWADWLDAQREADDR